MDREQADIEADLPQTVTIGGVSYACVTGGPADARALEMEGFVNPASFQVTVRKSLLTGATVLPAEGVLATYGGKAYRIDSIDPDPTEVCYLLNLVEAST